LQLWQVFAGAKERWVEGQYQELLASREVEVVKPTLEKWASQIEKVCVYTLWLLMIMINPNGHQGFKVSE